MRRKLALIIVPAMALSLLIALPGAHATGGCVARKGPGISEDQATCDYTADNHGRTGYWMALTPGSTWSIHTLIAEDWVLFADNNNPGGGTVPTCTPEVGSLGTGNRICAKSLDPLEGTTYRLTISSGAGILGLGPQQ